MSQKLIKSCSNNSLLLKDYFHLTNKIGFQLNRVPFESKHDYLMLLSLFKLTTSFDLCTGPTSGHKIYNWGDYKVWIINKTVLIIKIGYMYLIFNEISLSFSLPMVRVYISSLKPGNIIWKHDSCSLKQKHTM